jgi:hypothetical protein
MLRSRPGLCALLAIATLASLGAELPPEIPDGRDFGAGLTLERPTALAEVLRAPERFAEEPILLHGRISDVCQRKGCWTILRDGADQVRVRFRDYGFFLPTDSTGAEAFVEGVIRVETLSEKAARHYEAESRDGDPDAVTGPRREVGVVASGVRLIGRD